jgi:hypothetical protein
MLKEYAYFSKDLSPVKLRADFSKKLAFFLVFLSSQKA